jgi:hypothetical protein
MRDRADKEDELPALRIGKALSEGGHGPVAVSNFVEEFAVSNGAEMLGIGKI